MSRGSDLRLPEARQTQIEIVDGRPLMGEERSDPASPLPPPHVDDPGACKPNDVGAAVAAGPDALSGRRTRTGRARPWPYVDTDGMQARPNSSLTCV